MKMAAVTADPVCLSDFEAFALSVLPRNALDYYRSGADEQETLQDNRHAFSRYKLIPRCLIDVSKRSLSTQILGHNISFPVCIAPTAMNCMAHPDGERAVAKAAAGASIAFTASTIATTSVDDIAAAAPDGLRFFQMYIYKQREVTLQLLRRAEAAGYKAVLLTVDTPFFGKRRADNRNKFKLPPHLSMANFAHLDHISSGVNQAKNQSGLNEFANSLFDQTLTWKDVEWLKSMTNLPVVVKGVLSAEDAVLAVEHGVSGILVSNHGARQLDGVPATIDALGDIVQAVDGRCEVYLDGGVRSGTDVVKALALGAKCVFIGRPAIYALAYNGEAGVSKMLQILREEVSSALAFMGCTSVADLKQSMVVHESYFHKSKL